MGHVGFLFAPSPLPHRVNRVFLRYGVPYRLPPRANTHERRVTLFRPLDPSGKRGRGASLLAATHSRMSRRVLPRCVSSPHRAYISPIVFRQAITETKPSRTDRPYPSTPASRLGLTR